MKIVNLDLKKCNLSDDLTQNRSERRNRIQVADPNMVGTMLLFFYDDDGEDIIYGWH